MKIYLQITVFLASLAILASCDSRQARTEARLREFISQYETVAIPLYRDMNLASWDANISGTDEAWARSARASFEYSKIFTDAGRFSILKEIRESGAIRDSLLARQLELLYNEFLKGQADTVLIREQIRMETEISRKYSNFRVTLDGKKMSDNQVDDILRNSLSTRELRQAWEGSKTIGPEVADDIIRLARHRNLVARKTGFSNYHEMSLKLSGQDPEEVTKIFDELDSLTRDSFEKLKLDIDTFYSKRYKIPVSELGPWHYQNRFFQEGPEIYKVNFDSYYEKADPVKLASAFYNGIGLNVDDILAKSDLYEKPGKNQHAFSTDIDRARDVRTLDNIRPDSYWMNTILHELGHGVYSYYNDMSLPFTLRDAAHSFTTEAIANMFGRLATDPGWMKDMGIIDSSEYMRISENSYLDLRLRMLVFSRWAQVMYRFEKSMYEDPEQDLNKLWWDLVEKYQGIRKPDGRNMPDWASKIHIALYPCYYHNYLLGELLASQIYSYITSNITSKPSFAGEKAVGNYLRLKIFEPGARYYWNEMIERATGEKLTAKYYAKQFIR